MAVLHVRNIPDKLYRRVQKIAQAHGRSLSSEVVALFETAVRQDDQRAAQAALLQSIRQNRWVPPPGTPAASEMLRQVRDEREVERSHESAR